MSIPYIATPDWSPFNVLPVGEKPPRTRSVRTPEGVGDRLRATAFAELQAREAFLWAAETFEDVPDELRRAWQGLAAAEDKHLRWLLKRMTELGISITERAVSDFLWQSFISCTSGAQFAEFMASAEERGQTAGERFAADMAEVDPISAALFERIAIEEEGHVAIERKFFPKVHSAQAPVEPKPPVPRVVSSSSETS